MVACIASTIHLIRLTRLKCSPTQVPNATCVCRPYDSSFNETLSLNSNDQTVNDGAVKYVDLNCPEVESILTTLLIFSAVCNAIGAIVSGWYSYLHWSTRAKRPQYVKVRTNPNSVNANLIPDSSRTICVTNRNGRWPLLKIIQKLISKISFNFNDYLNFFFFSIQIEKIGACFLFG